MAATEKISLIPLSREEDDLVSRSAKKLKNGGKPVSSPVLQGEWPKLGAKKSEFSKGGPSFAEKLKGKGSDADSSDDENDNDGHGKAKDIMSEDESGSDDLDPPCILKDDPS